MSIIIALTPGDYNSIGPEVLLKAVQQKVHGVQFMLVSPPEWMQTYTEITGVSNLFYQPFSENTSFGYWWPQNSEYPSATVNLGQVCGISGQLSMMCVDQAIKLCIDGAAHAMVTAPISKEAIQIGGYDFAGHTEFLAEKTQTARYTMMLVSDKLRVGLVTTHIPVSSIAQQLTTDSIVEKLLIMNEALQARFSVRHPKIAVLALNPHAGDGGLMGSEERTVIKPALLKVQELGIQCEGPFPADGWFGSDSRNNFDAVLAMYHDQGLAPFKALSFGGGVNFTAGLPIIRTSPDHGTAFPLAGRNAADHRSMAEAIQLAITMASNSLKTNLSKR